MAEQVVAEYKLQVDEAVKGLDKLQKEVEELKKGLGDSGKKGKKAMSDVGNSVNGLSSKFKNLGTQILSAFGVVGTVYTFVAAIKSAIQINKEFELQMARVKAISGATSEEFVKLIRDAKRLGATTKFTSSEVASLQEEFAKLGFSTKEILNATEATLELAEATASDLATSANVAGQVLRAFGLDAAETQRVVDVMAKSFSSSALNISSFEESMKFAAPIARAAGIEIETVTALLGKLADSGLRGSIAGTGLKNLLSQLSDENSELGKELGFSVKNSDDLFRALNQLKAANIDLTKATELTDERSKAAFITLINGADDVKVLKDALDDAGGSASAMAEIMRDTLSGDMDRLKSATEGLALALGEGEGGLAQVVRLATQNWTYYIDVLRRAALSTEQLINQGSDEYFNRYKKRVDQSNESLDVLIQRNGELLIRAIENTQALKEQDRLTGDLLESRLSEIKGLQMLLAYLREKRDAQKEDNVVTAESIEETNTYVRSINQLNDELKEIQKSLKDAEIGSKEWIDLIEKMFNKTEELNDVNEELAWRLAVLEGAFDNYESIDTKGIDNFTDSVEKASAAIKKAREEAQTKSLQLTGDEFIDPKQGYPNASVGNGDLSTDSKWWFDGLSDAELEFFEQSLNEWSTYTQAISGMLNSLSQLSQALTNQELMSLEERFRNEQITREQYEQEKKQILRQNAEDQKILATFDATINGIVAVTKAYSEGGPVLAAIVGAAVAAQVAAIAAQPIPEFAKGVIDLKGAGTETSDSIHAKLSRGESVMTAKETRKYKEELWAIRRGNFEDLIITKYVKPMIDESLFKGFADLSKSAQLNGITANLKDHNILHGLDRLRQSQQQGFMYLAEEQRKLFKKQSRGGYRA